jgi:hypothetical protein
MTLRTILLVAGALGAAVLASAGGAEAAARCDMHASASWTPVPGKTFRSEAFSNGPTCAQAAVTIVVRAPDGSVLWVDAAPGEHIMTFAYVRSRQEMARALAEWLSQDATFKTTRKLPGWPEGAEGPESGEFPFMPEAWVDREAYERMRAEGLPMFCYVQGMESLACIALTKDGRMEKIGVQAFPG